MASFNKIVIVGYLGKDPEIRYTPKGDAVCNFSIATTEKRKNSSTGESTDQTTWFRITAWGRLGELANQYLSKGKQAYVEGRLRMEEYTDREGLRRHTLEVTASDIHFIGARSDSPGDSSGYGQQQQQQQQYSTQTAYEPTATTQSSYASPQDSFEPEAPHNSDDVPF